MLNKAAWYDSNLGNDRLVSTASALTALGVANNLHIQIGLVLLIALASKNAILIVEYARDRRHRGIEITEAAVEAARLRLRPILMTSFAFILGVRPLVFATGASARKSIGIAVASGMLASTILGVIFVPALYVVLQRLEERLRKSERGKPADTSVPA
jgi:hydrophobic/amphiphilic exporter-1 (mainly G- bacteria), HAE1 family